VDTLAHYLWAVALYWLLRKDRKWLLGISGALPDLLSFGPLFAYTILSGASLGHGPPALSLIPSWVFAAYNVTHSLVVIGIAFAILWVAKREWTVFLYGWILHILCDIPTHTRAYFPTPFLWPISSLTISGMSWARPWFMATNYAALAGVYAYLIWRDRTDGKIHRKH
jgi:mannose/fructose/N-acetylgalactosamine-specific phosphotransferase system component IIC